MQQEMVVIPALFGNIQMMQEMLVWTVKGISFYTQTLIKMPVTLVLEVCSNTLMIRLMAVTTVLDH